MKGTHDTTHMWNPKMIHFDIWQNEYNIVKFKNKIKKRKKMIQMNLFTKQIHKHRKQIYVLGFEKRKGAVGEEG